MTPSMLSAVSLVDADGLPYSLTNPLPITAEAGSTTAVTIADGADIAIGSTTDAASALTVNGLLKNIKATLAGSLTVGLPAGAATAAKQPTLGTAGSSSTDVLSIQGIVGGTALPVSGTFWQATQPVSGAVTVSGTATVTQGTAAAASAPWSAQLSDGTAAYTGAKTGQLPTALGITTKATSLSVALASDQVGTAGAGSTTVLTVQGNASGTAIPVSGTVTANAGSGTFVVSNANLDVALSTLSLKNQFPTTLGITAKAGSLSVALASDQVGTAGSAATTVLSVQGVGGGTTLPVTASNAFALDATLAKLTITQGTTLGSNTLVLAGGSVSTSVPTYTTGQLSPLSINTQGCLRVDASNNTITTTGSGSSGSAAAGVFSVQGISGMTPVQVTTTGNAATGAAVSGNPVLVAGKDSAGNVQPLALDTTGRPAGSSKTFITTNVTTQLIKSGAGVMRAIMVNPGITSAFLLYDSAGAASGQFSGAGTTSPGYLYELQYGPNGVAFTNGLVITTSGGTPAQLLVIYD